MNFSPETIFRWHGGNAFDWSPAKPAGKHYVMIEGLERFPFEIVQVRTRAGGFHGTAKSGAKNTALQAIDLNLGLVGGDGIEPPTLSV
jgi:hypothetical protein